MMRTIALLSALTLSFLVVHPALAESRGLTVELRTAADATAPVAEKVVLYNNSYALVIGNDAYRGGWPKLSNAVADAADIATELSDSGFEVTLKKNLDSAELRDTLREFFAIQGADPQARLLLWYAGHGHSIKGEGFLVPVDAPMPSDPAFKVRALQMRDFGSLMRLADAKHVLAIFDSCFSGTIFTTRAGAIPAAITQVTTHPTREIMTSGDADQQVSDDGTFRRLFLAALKGDTIADANGDGYLTGSELGLYMSNEVANYSEGAQTPRYGKLRDPDYDRGDFVFALPGRAETTIDDFGSDVVQNEPAASAEDTIIEITLWTTVVGSQDPVMVQTYLDAYPTGRFAKAAIARIADLKKQITARETAEAKAATDATSAGAAAAASAAAEAATTKAAVATVQPFNPPVQQNQPITELSEPTKPAATESEQQQVQPANSGSQVAPLDQCDLEAADPNDPDAVTRMSNADEFGLPQNPQSAFAACVAAINAWPAEPRFKLYLAGTLDALTMEGSAPTAAAGYDGLDLVRKAANAGYRHAVFLLGARALAGRYLEPGSDTQETAIALFKQAADLGHSDAPISLAFVLEGSQGTSAWTDYDEAARLLMAGLKDHNDRAYEALFTYSDSRARETIMSIQHTLSRAGFYSGRIDGDFGPKTQAALTEWANP